MQFHKNHLKTLWMHEHQDRQYLHSSSVNTVQIRCSSTFIDSVHSLIQYTS